MDCNSEVSDLLLVYLSPEVDLHDGSVTRTPGPLPSWSASCLC